ncbi:MAG TPA: hypothetical protein VHU19_14050 [Pyrinomonadaceae bacterium]|jgi:hypothetical protein|nr:hypothetical protein [Pyrinomonadaceae bacterium]
MPKIKTNVGEVECFDIPTMREMSDEEYRGIIDYGLVYVDHHENLRSYVAHYPIATTREQLDIFIEELQKLRAKMVAKSAEHLVSVDGTDKPAA